MAELLSAVLEHGSLLIVMFALIIAGIGVPVPEDIMLVAAGVLVARGEATFPEALVACILGVFIGDTSIFLLARRFGSRLLDKRPFRWVFTEERKLRTLGLFHRYGHVIVFIGRHMAGLRMPIFAMAGIHGVKLRTFWLFDGLGLLVSAPAMIGIGYMFATHLHRIVHLLRRIEVIIPLVIFIVVGAFLLIARARRRERRSLASRPPSTRPSTPSTFDSARR
jgi:membrane protein DedA with SNARE-associated domain